MSGTLYVVATPIGHLQDLSPRAAATLAAVAVVAAEDTRHSRTLLAHAGAATRLISVHQHAPAARIRAVVDRLVAGEDVALITDAGTPAVSDPGPALVAAARSAGVPVVPIPGPSAVAAALSASGFPADQYVFLGFPPRKGPERAAWLGTALASRRTVVAFESANRLVELLGDLARAEGGRRDAVVCREMTKLHEELKSGTLNDLAAYYGEHAPRGEVTVVLEGRAAKAEEPAKAQLAEQLARRLIESGLSRRDIVVVLQLVFGVPRNDAYALVTELDA